LEPKSKSTRLAKGGLFQTTPEYPEFVWNEIIVNAVAHRDYSIKGTDIQIKMFDNRIVVESPGSLPGLVRLNNIRTVHFSRNPKIAALLKEYKYVKEFGEGVDRMCNEMVELGLSEPEFSTVAFMTKVVINNNKDLNDTLNEDLNLTERKIASEIYNDNKITAENISNNTKLAISTVKRNLVGLQNKGILLRVGSKKTGYWEIKNKIH